jgi:hypothetical protein
VGNIVPDHGLLARDVADACHKDTPIFSNGNHPSGGSLTSPENRVAVTLNLHRTACRLFAAKPAIICKLCQRLPTGLTSGYNGAEQCPWWEAPRNWLCQAAGAAHLPSRRRQRRGSRAARRGEVTGFPENAGRRVPPCSRCRRW